jgi:ABC-2 type transport system ATP-binding protein
MDARSTAGSAVTARRADDAGAAPADAAAEIAGGRGDTLDGAAAPANAVDIRGLTKTYAGSGKTGPKTALTEVDLEIPRGSLFGLLGPNGAGKSTLINIMAGLVNKTEGTVRIWDYDIDKATRMARSAIGIVPQELNIDPFFTPRELLDLQAGLYGVPKGERITDELLEAVGLADKADAYARTLSGGMRRRLMVAKAMVHSPPVLVLDEPTAGVDIELRQSLWAHVRRLNEAGTTVLLTTHYLEEAEELCDRIAIIDHGRVVANDTTPALLGRLDSKTLTIVLSRPMEAVPEVLSAYQVELADPHRLVVRYRPSETRLGDILNAMNEAGVQVADLTTEETDLEDIFLQLTRAAPAPAPASGAASA